MIKLVRAFTDSQGAMHPTREGACKAEFRMMLEQWSGAEAFTLDRIVDAMFDIDKMIGEATKEDSSYQTADS